MERVRYNGQMMIHMMDNRKMIFIMDIVYSYGQMGVYLKANFNTIKEILMLSS